MYWKTEDIMQTDILENRRHHANGCLGHRYAKGVLQSLPQIAVARMKLTIIIKNWMMAVRMLGTVPFVKHVQSNKVLSFGFTDENVFQREM